MNGRAGARGDAAARDRVDRRQFVELLRVYLRISLRRSTRGFASGQGSGVRGVAQALVFYAAFGVLTGVVALDHPDVFTYALFMMSATLFAVMSATSFVATDVLLNVEESEVLAARPISARTLLAAKAANLAAFGLGIATTINLAPAFFGLAARGAKPWFPLVHWLASVLLAVLCAGAVVLLYGVLMRTVPRRSFERAAIFGQIVLTFGIIASAQTLPRILPDLQRATARGALGWIALLPVTWFAALDEALAGSHGDAALAVLALGGCALTVGVFVAAVARLAPAFGEGLQALAEERTRPPAPSRAVGAGAARLKPLLRLWLRDPVERSAFRLATASMVRDREIMMRLWPGIAAFFVLPLLSILGGRAARGEFFFVASVTLAFTSTISLQILESSSHYAAADLFVIAPLASTLPLVHGTRKAVLACIVLPLALVLAGITLLAGRGDASLLPALVPGLLLAFPCSLLPAAIARYAPLSAPVRRGLQETRGLVLALVGFALMIPVAFAARWAERHGRFVAFLAVELALVVVLQLVFTLLARRRSRIAPLEEE
jgi:ABC-2 type transport system permease protein